MLAIERLSQVKGGGVVALVVVALIACFAVGDVADPAIAIPSPDPARAAYFERVSAILRRYDLSAAALDKLLTQRDENPGLVGSAEWLQQHARVAQELQAEYQDAQSIAPPRGNDDLQTCVVEALRLTSIGASMLHDAFLTDGHGAYYLGAHGNWDLYLGSERIQRCRVILDGWHSA